MSDLRARLEPALAGRYSFERELGSGGMAVVWLALDLRHQRRVAIKVFRPELSASMGPERFHREIEILAKLNHPHILPLHDSGEAGGLLYFVMPWVEGESLRDRLEREVQLPLEDSLSIAREVADALGYAHSRGVIHRDIKPENILLSAGHALVADFGVAWAIDVAGGARLTETRVTVGTPLYMSPEQAMGERGVDGRADIYALGCVLFKMLAGAPPFHAPTSQAMLARRLVEPVPLLRTHRQSVPEEIDRAVAKALARVPADRFATPESFAHALAHSTERKGWQKRIAVRTMGAVLGIYLLGSWASYQVISKLVDRIGMPDWVRGFAIVLLIIGLPIVLATAFVQVALSTSRPRRADHDTAASRRDKVTVRLPHQRLFTWRNAIYGGAAAFSLLGLSMAGYMTLRASGVGPAGSLIARGLWTTRAPLLVADFQSATGDSVTARTVTEALRVDLTQSPVVKVVESASVGQALRRMQKPLDTPLSGSLAVELAAREGVSAVLAGEVNKLGTGFVLTARLLSVPHGEELVALGETAQDSAQLLVALNRLSKRLRERVGESYRSLGRSQPLEQVTTSSLEALRIYSEANREIDLLGNNDRGIALLEEAVALDTAFAMAYRKLGTRLAVVSGARARAFDALSRAYHHRDRLTERERYLAVGTYYNEGVWRPDSAINAFQNLLRLDPMDEYGLIVLGLIYSRSGDPERAEDYLRRAIRVDSSNLFGYQLLFAQTRNGRFAAADTTLAEYRTRAPDAQGSFTWASALASSRGDFDRARQELIALAERSGSSPQDKVVANSGLAAIAATRGGLSDAGAHRLDAMTTDGRIIAGMLDAVAAANLDAVVASDSSAAVEQLDASLAKHSLTTLDPLDRPYLEFAVAYARAGRPATARRLLAEYDSVVPPEMRAWSEVQTRPRAAAVLALAEGRPLDAVAEMRINSGRTECTVCDLILMALAFDEAEQPDSARVAYERYLDTPYLYRTREVDHLYLGHALERLGQLYEADGNATKAAEYYNRFVSLWQDADQTLQPRVTAARRRLANIIASRG